MAVMQGALRALAEPTVKCMGKSYKIPVCIAVQAKNDNHRKARLLLCGGMGIIMKQTKRTSVVKKTVAAALAVMFLLSSGTTAFAGKTLAESINFQEQVTLDDVLYNNNYYSDYKKENSSKFSDVTDASISVNLGAYTAVEGAAPEFKSLEGKDNVLYLSEELKSISWEIDVTEAGFYQLSAEYLPVDGNGIAVTRGLLIDGEYLYDELSNFKFYRRWVDAQKPKVNNLGDEVRPSQQEIQEWSTAKIYDAGGEYPEPLKIGLTAGKHTISLVYVDQPLALASLTFEAPRALKSYKDVLASYKANGYKNAKGEVIFQAEDKDYIDYKSDSGITIASDSDSTLTPVGVTYKRYNYIGDSSWNAGGEEIVWKFSVKESGLYVIAPRFVQSYGNGLSSTRQIKIDGEVPFKEFDEYVFTYDEDWTTKPLGDGKNPYYVYLEKGEHTLSMKVVMGPLTDVIHTVTDITSRLSNAIRNITMVTGQSPDLNYDYQLERQIPSLLGDLQTIVDELKDCNEKIAAFAVKTTPIENNFKMCYELIEKMIKKPVNIPAEIDELSSSLTSIGTWLSDLKSQPLGIDKFQIISPDTEIVDVKASFWDRMYGLFANFFLSYTKDYSAVGYTGEGSEEYETIEVWVARGKEWCEILKELTDTSFSAKHKINVDIRVLPSGTLGGGTSPLLLSINAGTEPDVVVGITNTVPVEYAIRNAMYDLTKFDDFEEVAKQNLAESFVPLTYEGGIYGVPETMSFTALFYRTDIFDQLDMKVPETWDEVCNDLLPQLYQYNMQFYMPQNYAMMIYQNGGAFYTETGYTSLLDDPKTMKGMNQLVRMYTDFGCPVSSSFLNRIRSGEMPIGVASFDMYLQLIYAAPELAGKWKMALVPGTVQEDGTIDRCVGQTLGTAVSILSTTDKADAAWEFVKWYTGDEAQTEYGRQVESILGIQSRWHTANINAFKRLPWSTDDLKIIEESWKSVKEIPGVLGGYFTTRHITNAFNRCVISGQSVRESMEEAAEDVNKELRRKQQMYKVNPEGKK